jgi:hypothetical protein
MSLERTERDPLVSKQRARVESDCWLLCPEIVCPRLVETEDSLRRGTRLAARGISESVGNDSAQRTNARDDGGNEQSYNDAKNRHHRFASVLLEPCPDRVMARGLGIRGTLPGTRPRPAAPSYGTPSAPSVLLPIRQVCLRVHASPGPSSILGPDPPVGLGSGRSEHK